MAEDEPFLRRWARRKASVRDTEPAATSAALPDEPARPTPEPHAVANTEPEATNDADEEPRMDATDLPDIDSLDKESDFRVFMRDGVPEQLRNRALRRLWRLDPAFASVDGLLEYDDDFTDAALAVEAVQTVYKIGKGMRKDDEAETAENATDAAASDEEAPKDSEERLKDGAEETMPTASDGGENTAAAGESEQAPIEQALMEKNPDA